MRSLELSVHVITEVSECPYQQNGAQDAKAEDTRYRDPDAEFSASRKNVGRFLSGRSCAPNEGHDAANEEHD